MTPLIRNIERDYYIPGADRDDVHQEALVALDKATKDYRPGGASFENFAALCIRRRLMTAVKTACGRKHLVLTRRANPQRILTHDYGESEEDLRAFLDPDSDPHDVLVAREDWEEFVRLASGSLSELEGQIFGLWLSGLSYADISERTGQDHKSVDNAMQRCKRKLTAGMALAA